MSRAYNAAALPQSPHLARGRARANCDKCTSVNGVDASHFGGAGSFRDDMMTAYDVKPVSSLEEP